MTEQRMRMLFVGDDWYGSNATSLRNAFTHLGHDVRTINTFELASARKTPTRQIARRLGPAAYATRMTARMQDAIHTALAESHFDVLFVFKGNLVSADVVTTSAALTVHYHPDDSSNPVNVSDVYRAAESHYDLHVTTKLHNIAELKLRAPDSEVLFVRCAYDRDWHRAEGPMEYDRAGLVGTRRADRVQMVTQVARAQNAAGQRMLVVGSGWNLERELRRLAEVRGPMFGVGLSDAVRLASVQIGALNSDNRDTHTCRSYEIPASGGLLIAQATDEHREILGPRAMLFRDDREVVDMVGWACKHPAAASRIASAVRERITLGGNTYEDRAAEIIAKVMELR